MSTDLILIGAGGSSREIAGAAVAVPSWNVLGYLDDDPAKQGAAIDGLLVLGTVDDASRFPRAQFLVGIAGYPDLTLRRRLVERLGLPRERFATVIHPSAYVSEHAVIGRGAALLQGVVVTSGAVVGDHVLLCQGCLLAHDVRVGDFTAMASAAVLNGSVRVEECVYVGSGAVLAPNIRVGREAIVGIGSTVVRHVRAGCSVFGNPARVVNVPGELRRHEW